ncbi:glycosyltransferase family protein [Psychrobacter immobilis]|uniref:glycosyltransferase family protein n=1 Tax=Psychrobacter immobilis TaxID=498 RepID=UPI00191843F0|nr:glycosyltransferase [Psychrobacter immobilis]
MKNIFFKMLSKKTNEFSQAELEMLNNLIEQYGGSIDELKYYIRSLELENEKNRLNKSAEKNTISYQLGKSIIDLANKKTGLKLFSKQLSSLYVESLRRKHKYLSNASLLDKVIIMLEDKDLQEDYCLDKRVVISHDITEQSSSRLLKDVITEDAKEDKKEDEQHVTQSKKFFIKNIINETEFKQNFFDKKVKIAAIMDEFTSFCFDPEADFLHLTPDNWQEEIDSFKPDLLFIESAWKGKDDLWKLQVSQCSEELQALIDGCNQRGIRTVFWSKEDPVHFGTFLDVAKKVDVVFTTDIDCIQKYKKHVNHNDVFLLPFAAQPKLHNPIELYERKNKFNFAGSYYLKYPRRQRDFEVLSSVAKDIKGLDIFDRNFNKPHPHYQFPQRFEPMILGSLAPHEIDKAYKGYHYGINMNTIKQSQTMFARRVFEMLASNTIVMSNYSRGVRLLFGDLVICSDDGAELTRQLEKLESDSTTREKFKLQGLRHVLRNHTYEHRLKYILQKTFKTSLDSEDLSTTVISYIQNENEYDKLIESYERQELVNKRLIILSKIPLNENVKQDVSVLNTKEELIKAIDQLDNEASIAVFNPNDSYGKHYLSDFILSYSYLPSDSQESMRLTKNSYFENSNGALSLVSGEVYKYVNQLSLSRSLLKLDDFKTNIIDKIELQDLNDKKVELKAFSTDSFSYVLNGAGFSESTLALSHEDLTIDEGVDFLNKLLPLSESIQGSDGTTELTKKVTINTLVANANKHIEVTELENKFQIKSNLPDKQHRYISVLDKLALAGASKVHTHLDIQASNSIELVFEYFDSKGQKTSFEIKDYAPSIVIENINNSAFMSISIRVNGTSDLVLGSKFKLQLINNIISTESKYQDPSTITFSAAEINKQLVRPKSKQITIGFKNGLTELKSTLADDKFAYVYFKTIYNRDDINLKLNSHYSVEAESNFDVRQVFVFLDENKEKISHSMVKVENSHTMPIPSDCKFIKIGYKLSGSGITRIKSLMIGETVEAINSLVCKSDTLILAKQYPAYDDLYKYGFLHSRLRAYKSNGFYPDMFKMINTKSGEAFREFESIDVFNGNNSNLREVLSSGQVKHVFVHLIDKQMWEALTEFKDKINISIWLHGAEVQSWKRREFDFKGLTEGETNKKKRLADNRVKFWQNIIKKDLNNKIKLIFVSNTFLKEVESDLGFDIPNENKLVIHNYVDSNIFRYSEKKAEHRFKLLSIRPYMGPKYGNDITVQAIQELANYDFFNKLDISIYGDGPEFDSINRPLLEYDNVHLHKRFLSHNEIVEVHKENGVFLNPTRWDSQGVSRDEAMSSGLVVVTNKVAAVPEFISEKEGALFEGEDIHEMVKEIVNIIKSQLYFLISQKLKVE